MTPLEERYRSVLRLLPRSYRKVWEEEMVTAFLESMHTDDPEDAEYLADYGRPSWSEVASVGALALRLRLGFGGMPPRSVAWGDAIRLVALIGLLVNAVFGLSGAGMRLWLAGRIEWLPAPPARWVLWTHFDFWHTAADLSGLVWVAAFVAVLHGYFRAARWLAAFGLVPGLIIAVLYTVERPAVEPLLSFLFGALLVLALGAYHEDSPMVPVRPWLIALGVGAAGVATVLSPLLPEAVWPFADWPALCCVALVAAAVGHLAQRPASTTWSQALALLAAGVLVLRLATLADELTDMAPLDQPVLATAGLVEAAAVLAVGMALGGRAARALRRLPAADRPARDLTR